MFSKRIHQVCALNRVCMFQISQDVLGILYSTNHTTKHACCLFLNTYIFFQIQHTQIALTCANWLDVQ